MASLVSNRGTYFIHVEVRVSVQFSVTFTVTFMRTPLRQAGVEFVELVTLLSSSSNNEASTHNDVAFELFPLVLVVVVTTHISTTLVTLIVVFSVTTSVDGILTSSYLWLDILTNSFEGTVRKTWRCRKPSTFPRLSSAYR